MAESKLEAARRTGSLTEVITAMREEAQTEAATAGAPAREQVGVEDAAIRIAASAAAGTTPAERRSIFRELRSGTTVTSEGVGKTQLSRAEKLTKAIALVKGWTEEQRDQFMVSEKFEAMSDRQQELLSEAIAEVQDREYSDSIGIQNIDLNAPTPEVDDIIGEAEDDDSDIVDDSDFETMFEQASWESETE